MRRRNKTDSAQAEGRRAVGSMIDQAPVPFSVAREDEPSVDETRLRQQAIGVKLRQMFDEVVSEPIPDEFLEILKRADDLASPRASKGKA